jgi:lysophospholipid acyltransferase (LPLAT)-like uncharacterized protein
VSEASRNWKLSLQVRLGSYLIRGLASTWRYRVVNADSYRALVSQRRPFIFAFWHGQLLPLAWLHRGHAVSVVISSHRDGELIARLVERLGMRTIRGSSSRGAARALLGVVRELENAGVVAITPDGPRGPAGRFAPGALVAAQRAGAPIIGIGVSARRCWRLRSWDRFLIPKPFAVVNVHYSAPTYVSAASAREAESEAARFEALLGDATGAAERA